MTGAKVDLEMSSRIRIQAPRTILEEYENRSNATK
jgi:hypothetical protein